MGEICPEYLGGGKCAEEPSFYEISELRRERVCKGNYERCLAQKRGEAGAGVSRRE